MKHFLCLTIIGCLINGSACSMQRITKPVAPKVVPTLIARHCSSKPSDGDSSQASNKEDMLKHVKEGLGTKSDYVCCAYLGLLGYLFYNYCMPKSAYRHSRLHR